MPSATSCTSAWTGRAAVAYGLAVALEVTLQTLVAGVDPAVVAPLLEQADHAHGGGHAAGALGRRVGDEVDDQRFVVGRADGRCRRDRCGEHVLAADVDGVGLRAGEHPLRLPWPANGRPTSRAPSRRTTCEAARALVDQRVQVGAHVGPMTVSTGRPGRIERRCQGVGFVEPIGELVAARRRRRRRQPGAFAVASTVVAPGPPFRGRPRCHPRERSLPAHRGERQRGGRRCGQRGSRSSRPRSGGGGDEGVAELRGRRAQATPAASSAQNSGGQHHLGDRRSAGTPARRSRTR